ncbi:MAG: sulfotransferase [Pseudomonadota bacterium]
MTKKTFFLLGMGAQKCGTSWLAKQLKHHPDFLISPIKELHYWDRRFHPDFFRPQKLAQKIRKLVNSDLDALATTPLLERFLMERHEGFYLSFFESRLKDHHKAFGEFSPSYCILSEDELRYIQAFMPYPTKALFSMRDPVARLWSQCKMEQLKATNRNQPYEAFHTFRTAVEDPHFYARSDYATTVRNMDAAFAPEDRHYVFFEELFSQDAIDKILEFLGLGTHDFNFEDNPNEGLSIARPDPEDWQRVAERFLPIYDFVQQRFGRLPKGWKPPQ